jgi:hypothetical protein
MQAPAGSNAAQRLRAFCSDSPVPQHAFHAHTTTAIRVVRRVRPSLPTGSGSSCSRSRTAASGAEEHHWVADQRSGEQSPQSNRLRRSGAAFRSALADSSRGNSHSQWLRDPKPARSNLMRRDFFACLNALVWVMRCRSLSNPAARALASSLVTAWAPSTSATRRNFTTFDSAARAFIRRIWPSGGRTERRGVMANGALCSHANRPPLQSRRRPAAGVLERGDESGDLSGPIRKGEVARTREGDWQSLAVP